VKMKEHGGAYAALKALGDDVMAQIDAKLTAGESGGAVAKWLQEEMKLLTDSKRPSLTRKLERYRGTELRNKVISRITEAATSASIKTLAKRVNAMDELEEMVRIQRTRVDKMLALEEGKPMLIGATTGEIKLLKEMLVDLGRVQLETGFLTRAPKTIKGVLANARGERIEFSWTEEQEQLYRELESVERRAEEV
jgi:hypothetical protein